MPALANPKQERFCREYLVDLNGTQAALRAGYANGDYSRELLRKTTVQRRIRELQKGRAKRVDIRADRVLKELARIGFSDITDFADWNEEGVALKDSQELKKRASRAIQEIIATDKGVKIKLHSKIAALKMLAQHLGILERGQVDIDDINLADLNDDELQRLADGEGLAAVLEDARSRLARTATEEEPGKDPELS